MGGIVPPQSYQVSVLEKDFEEEVFLFLRHPTLRSEIEWPSKLQHASHIKKKTEAKVSVAYCSIQEDYEFEACLGYRTNISK